MNRPPARPKSIEQSVRDFTKRLHQLQNEEGKSAMPIDEALQWASEMQRALEAAPKKQG